MVQINLCLFQPLQNRNLQHLYYFVIRLGNEFNTDPLLKELDVIYNTLWIKIIRVVIRVQHDTKDLIDEVQPRGFTDTL